MDVLLIDDQPNYASSLRILASRAFGDVRMRTARSLSTGLHQAGGAESPDLVVLRLNVSGSAGIEALLRFRRQFPSLRVLVIDRDDDASRSTAALEAGAIGYLPGTISLLATVASIRLLAEGGTYVPASERFRSVQRAEQSDPRLTTSEISVLRLLGRGLDSEEIARQLNVAEDIVELQVLGILLALGASSRLEALVIAARHGLMADE